MGLFVVQHKHSEETCPAQDPRMGSMLLQHLSAPNAEKYGVKIHGEAVVNGAHTLYLIAEADDQSKLDEFMYPFSQAGSVDVMPASHCEVVVDRGSC